MTVDLTDFDEGFEPAAPRSLLMKPEELPDSPPGQDYEFLIAKAKYITTSGDTKKGKDPHRILKLELQVLSAGKYDGAKVDHAIFLDDLDAAKRVGRVLQDLGFDVDNWKKETGRPFSVEFPKAVALLNRLRLRVKGAKRTNESKGKTYHNIYINGRTGTDGQPAKFTQADLNAPDPADPFGDADDALPD